MSKVKKAPVKKSTSTAKKTITLKDAIGLQTELNNLLVEKGVPFLCRINARKITKELKDDLESFFEERKKLVETLGEKQDDGENFKIPPSKSKEFSDTIEKALEQELKISLLITLDDIESISSDSVNSYATLIDILID